MVHFWKDNSHKHSVRLPGLRASQSQDHHHQMTTQKEDECLKRTSKQRPPLVGRPQECSLISLILRKNALKRTQIREGERAVEFLKFDYLNWCRFHVTSWAPSLWLIWHSVGFPIKTANSNAFLSKHRVMFTSIDLQHFVIAALIHSYLTNQHLLLIIRVITACNTTRRGPMDSTPALYWKISGSKSQILHKISSLTRYFILHVCTVHQQYQDTFSLFQTDAHNYKITGILKQLKFHICHPGMFLLTHTISLLSVIHTIYSIIQTKI